MIDDWPTRKQDMEAAQMIIDRYERLNDGEPLNLLNVSMNEQNDEPVDVAVPDWIVELMTYFRDQYGYEHGHAVTSRIITQYLLKQETIH